jgi:NAD(P)-dependent dehydrogenase (short-subunit alcohol dehydrogenase family)
LIGSAIELHRAAVNVASKICLHQVDLTDKATLESAAANLFEQGPLDILVNNAGTQGAISPITEQDDETWSKVISMPPSRRQQFGVR